MIFWDYGSILHPLILQILSWPELQEVETHDRNTKQAFCSLTLLMNEASVDGPPIPHPLLSLPQTHRTTQPRACRLSIRGRRVLTRLCCWALFTRVCSWALTGAGAAVLFHPCVLLSAHGRPALAGAGTATPVHPRVLLSAGGGGAATLSHPRVLPRSGRPALAGRDCPLRSPHLTAVAVLVHFPVRLLLWAATNRETMVLNK